MATKDFSAYQATTAKSIDSKVSSNDFNTYKTQTADLIDDKVSSSEYASDKTQTASEIADRVSNSAFSTYQTQTASQIASKVDNGAFSAYQTTTADLIAQKVATSDFSAYQATTAKEISSKVESSDFKTYQTQTADMIASKVSKSDANNVNLIPYSAMPEADNLQWAESGTGGTLSATTHAFYHSGADSLYELNTAGSTEVFAKSPRFKINANATYTFQLKGFASSNVSSMDVYVLGRPNGSTSDFTVAQEIIKGAVLSKSALDYRTVTFTTGAIDEAYLRIDNNGSTNGTISILGFTELKLEPGDTATPYVYGAEDTMIAQMADDILFKVTKGDLIDEINLQAGNTLISSSGQLTLAADTIYFDAKKPVIIPSANITGTLNGKTINAGSRLNSYGNTSYPLTINQDGSVTSTSFETIDTEIAALRTVIKDGTVKTNLRGMTPFATGMYSAADVSLGAGQLALLEGYSTSQDPNFNATGMKTTGYAILDASAGLSLHGTTQAINFSGTDQDQTTGITMNSYGNIIGYPNSTWWRIVSNSGSNIANFGIDRGGSNVIQFNRELDIGNFHINTGHTFTSADGGAIHFAKGRGGANDIYAGDVHYNSLVKSSLLSVKRDVKKADTSYWAQLVNSIDLATYQYKTDDNTSQIRLSSIVDDVNDTKQWQLPDVFINRDEDGKLNGVDDSVLLNATLATVQEQQKQIDQLNGHLLELEAKLNG
ncbi:phage tail protein [Lactiplantibacillus pentosus]|uniref:phage tail protein n=1 Tax=Lactiplantibacillus pentosus TaxID=1589 RepID=UPI003C1DD65E